MKLVPLIGYMKADPEQTRFTGNFDNRVNKYWALVSFMSEVQRSHVYENGVRVPVGELKYEKICAEFCIKSAGMVDFCGGTWFASPQVSFFQRGSWNNDSFCNPGNCESIDCSWEAFEKDKDRAIDLAEFTGQEVWTTEQVMQYGKECIAMACMSTLISRGTDGWVCSDYIDGTMNQIHDIMCSYNEMEVPYGHAISVSKISKEITASKCPPSLHTYKITCIDHGNPEYRNSNSGNQVRIMTGTLEREPQECDNDGEVKCPNCETWHDMGCCNECHECGHEFKALDAGEQFGLGGQAGRALSNPLYLQQARRYDWSNG